jgi:hypothetical protein
MGYDLAKREYNRIVPVKVAHMHQFADDQDCLQDRSHSILWFVQRICVFSNQFYNVQLFVTSMSFFTDSDVRKQVAVQHFICHNWDTCDFVFNLGSPFLYLSSQPQLNAVTSWPLLNLIIYKELVVSVCFSLDMTDASVATSVFS